MYSRLRRRWNTMRAFAAAGRGPIDRCLLALAGFARHRPFGDNSFYSRFGRRLARQVAPRIALAGGQRVLLDLTMLADLMIFEEIYVERIYPVDRVRFEPDVVIDCGACTGMFTLLARAHFSAARVVAWEPQPDNFRRLRENCDLNQARIEARQVAAGVQRGQAHFAGAGFGGHLTDASGAGTITVEVASLPDLLRELKPERLVLKMDVEGAEQDLLPAIVSLLPRETIVFLETHHEESECEAYLRPYLAAGFSHEMIRHRPDPDQPSAFVERLLMRPAS